MSENLLPRNKLLCHIFPHGTYARKKKKKSVGLTDLYVIVKLKTQTNFQIFE